MIVALSVVMCAVRQAAGVMGACVSWHEVLSAVLWLAAGVVYTLWSHTSAARSSGVYPGDPFIGHRWPREERAFLW